MEGRQSSFWLVGCLSKKWFVHCNHSWDNEAWLHISCKPHFCVPSKRPQSMSQQQQEADPSITFKKNSSKVSTVFWKQDALVQVIIIFQFYDFLTYLPKPHVTKRSSLHKPQWQAKRRKQRNEYLVVYWKTYSSSPCAKHRHQAATYSATKQQKDGKSALHSYILLRFSTIHFKKSKSSDPEIFTTFSKYVGKERKEKETKSHRDREKHRDKSIQKEGKYPVPLSMTTAGRPAASMATTTTTATTAHLPQSKTVKKTQL